MKNNVSSSAPIYVNPEWRIGMIASSFYKEEIDSLCEEAHTFLVLAGIEPTNIKRYDVPGSFEIPLIGAALAEKHSFDALIGFGIIVEGETQHARLIAEQAARGIMDVQVRYRIPFAFEVLYVQTLEQAKVRAIGDGNKGKEAAAAVLHSLAQLGAL